MPRRTKKQKERTALKRNQTNLVSNGSTGVRSEPVKREFEFTFENITPTVRNNIKNKQSDKTFYFYQSASTARDLVKTATLAIIIFSLEIMIYFAWFKQTNFGYQIHNLINGQFNKLF